MNPVTGPVLKVISRPDFYSEAECYKQARPYNLPLPYRFRSTRRVRDDINPGTRYLDSSLRNVPAVSDAASVAYDRFKNGISSSAQLGATMAEFSKSFNMIETRAFQLVRVFRSLRHGNIGAALYHLKHANPFFVPLAHRNKKAFANIQLEYSYGWAPLAQDIYSALEFIQEPIKDVYVKASAKRVISYPPASNRPPFSKVFDGSVDTASVAYGSRVYISNPNLYALNQLGLINLPSVLLELTPWSFVLDWFSNASQVVSSLTDFYGLTLLDPWTRIYVESDLRFKWTNYDYVEHHVRVNLDRDPGISSPSFYIRPYQAPGLRRAVNAVSLLVQQLGR